MSNQQQTKAEKKSALLNYVGNFIEKHDNQSNGDGAYSSIDRFDKDSVIIKTGEGDFRQTSLDKRPSGSTDLDCDEFSFVSDPAIETREGDEQVYKQQVYLRQYQPPTPDPIDIQVQEVYIKPQIQRPPIHVHITPNKNQNGRRSLSPVLIKSAPPEPSVSSENTPIFYNKYIPVNNKSVPRQIVIHHHPALPSKPRPILIEQWLPNKPPPRRITYHHVNQDEFIQNEIKRTHNRYIEHEKPHAIVELEIIRLPVMKLNPKEYSTRSDELTQLNHIRSTVQDPNTLQWRI